MARSDPRNTSEYWWDRHTPGLSLLRADFTTHEYPPHQHEAFVIAVTEDGGSIVRSRGAVEEADTASLFVFNPAEPHAGWMGRSRRWLYRSLYLERPAIDAVARGLGIDAVPYFIANRFPDRDLIEAFLRLHRALEGGADLFEEQERLVGTFGVLFGRHGRGGGRIAPAPRDQVLLRGAIDVMQARYGEALHLDALAAAVGLTTFQLIGLFRRTIGLTPHAYLTQIRLNAACRHLKRGVRPAEVAFVCGFYDQSALNRHFKRSFGITPLQFARAAGAANFRQYPVPAAA